MIRLPQTIEQALVHAASHDVRAGGTDLQERRSGQLGTLRPLLDLRDVSGLDRIERSGDGLQIGARVRLAEIARDPYVRERYPALAQSAGALGTPQIREVASLGGSLLQAVRCAYFRDPSVRCLRSGGAECWARQGDHLWHVCFASGPCIAPHASTLGMVLLASDARLRIAGGSDRSASELYGIGDSIRDHTLEEGALLTHVQLPAPWSEERVNYMRASHRARAEWALVEVVVRLRLSPSRSILAARVAVGAVANTPLRLPKVEHLVVGERASESLFRAAGQRACDGAAPLPMTAYKVELLAASVFDALTRAAKSSPSPVFQPQNLSDETEQNDPQQGGAHR